jgi:hypothetical protein
MDQQEADHVANWARRESRRLEKTWPSGSPMENRVLAGWKVNRPKMCEALEKRNALKALAHVLVNEAVEAERRNQRAGLPLPDAREEAARDWLLSEPEDDGDNPILTDQEDHEAPAHEEEFSGWRVSGDDCNVLFRVSEKLRELAPLARRGTDLVALGEALEALETFPMGTQLT